MRKRMFHIDEDALDQEKVQATKDLREVGRLTTEAKRELALLEQELGLKKAKFMLKVRRHPKDYDLPDRPAVALVDAVVLCDPIIQALITKIADAQRDYDDLRNALRTIEKKMSEVHDLIDLHKTNYYSDPERLARMEDKEKMAEQARHGIKKKRRKP